MRLLVLGVIVLALALIVIGILIHQAETRQAWQAAEAEAQWVSGHDHDSDGPVVHVVVRRLATLHGRVREVGPTIQIASINVTDPEWSEKFREAKQVAYDRAIDLNMRI